jgi:hypothetical protein
MLLDNSRFRPLKRFGACGSGRCRIDSRNPLCIHQRRSATYGNEPALRNPYRKRDHPVPPCPNESAPQSSTRLGNALQSKNVSSGGRRNKLLKFYTALEAFICVVNGGLPFQRRTSFDGVERLGFRGIRRPEIGKSRIARA